uniref:Coiled-coil domain-containing protein 50-like n=1 Tax=Dermatophagoides pteronyssinus TaxID=6956 RepID=A0A6P6XNR3_DERPT|nr:coiled-coil domain-containing protein 50-like [Dermatophagoides pteronyssinus]
MADCQINSISDQPSNSKDVTTIIPEGRVGEVCKEWLIREDGNLAYRLQNEEIEQHYNENRSKNQLVRKDIPLAKHLQKNEILEAQQKYERFLQEQIIHDEKIARKIEHRLLLEEEEAKKAAEEADAKLAKKLMEKEKAKQIRKRIEKEKQQVERLSAQIGTDFRSFNMENFHEPTVNINQKTLDRYARSKNHRIMTEDEQELDLSEFCMPPPPGLNPEELKLFLEEQDAEIAQLLQHQELKRSRNPEKEKLASIEQQDFEIAKMLQKMEKDRYKKIKEKLRNNQRLNRSSDQDSNFPEERNYQRTSTPLTSMDSLLVDANKVENDYDIPENHLTSLHDQTYEEPYNVLNECSETTLAQSFHNIAIDLDPTYRRRLKQTQCSSSQGNLTESCVDDDDNDYRAEQVNKTGSPTFLPTHRSYRDSLEKLHSTSKITSEYSRNPPSTCTSSSRSSNTSSENRNLHNPEQQKSDDFAPPLPPRDMSLMHNYKPTTTSIDQDHHSWKESIKSRVSNNLLPPHHPQHPNRQFNDFLGIHSLSDNDQSSTNNAIVQGQWRMPSLEKPQKKINKPDGCRTQ